MFNRCYSLTEIDFSNCNTKNVLNMEQMLEGCTSLTSINLLGKFTTENVRNMNEMTMNNQYLAIDAITLENCNPEIYEDLCTVTGYYGDYLSEETKNGVVRYWPDNLYVKDGNPWVADSKKNPNGIGASITLYTLNLKNYYSFGIYNGYQKDDLYEKN